jgi:hypothetical protein
MCLGTSPRFLEKINPEGLDIFVEVLKLIPAEKVFQFFKA